MVNFIRPGVLNDYSFFKHFFELPILNGMCTESTQEDIAEARRRSFVLQKQLSNFVLRRDASVLHKTLPPKYEWVIHCRMTHDQVSHPAFEMMLQVFVFSQGTWMLASIPPWRHFPNGHCVFCGTVYGLCRKCCTRGSCRIEQRFMRWVAMGRPGYWPPSIPAAPSSTIQTFFLMRFTPGQRQTAAILDVLSGLVNTRYGELAPDTHTSGALSPSLCKKFVYFGHLWL